MMTDESSSDDVISEDGHHQSHNEARDVTDTRHQLPQSTWRQSETGRRNRRLTSDRPLPVSIVS